jgi:hypothetical protein
MGSGAESAVSVVGGASVGMRDLQGAQGCDQKHTEERKEDSP